MGTYLHISTLSTPGNTQIDWHPTTEKELQRDELFVGVEIHAAVAIYRAEHLGEDVLERH